MINQAVRFFPGMLRCVGICWLATTDFLVAYSPLNGVEVDIAFLCVKKDSPPKWTHFEDVNYCSKNSLFDQQIKFIPVLDWQFVIVASSRSCEVILSLINS